MSRSGGWRQGTRKTCGFLDESVRERASCHRQRARESRIGRGTGKLGALGSCAQQGERCLNELLLLEVRHRFYGDGSGWRAVA